MLELSLAGDALAGDAVAGNVEAGDTEVVSELFCGVLKVELAIVLVAEEVDDVKAVDGLELDEL